MVSIRVMKIITCSLLMVKTTRKTTNETTLKARNKFGEASDTKMLNVGISTKTKKKKLFSFQPTLF